MKLNIDAPFNSLSLGNISYGVTRELLNNGIELNIFPKMGNADLGAFDRNCDEFKQKFTAIVNSSLKNYDINAPTLSIWHILGSQYKLSKRNYLLTFHECDQLTQEEVSVLNSFDSVFVTSSYSESVFKEAGVKSPVHFVRLGVDETQFYPLNKSYLDENICVWTVIGKLEFRKAHKEVIQGWCKKFANSPSHRLHLFLTNPFLKPEQINGFFSEVFQGQQPPWNVKIFPYQPLNSQINDALNATSVIIDMSRAEALSLPSLNAVALGRHALIHNATAMKDWASEDNATLVESSGLIPCYDGVFFAQGQPMNQGNFWSWNENDYLNGLDKIFQKWKYNKINTNGYKLKNSYSYKNGVNHILDIIKE